MFDLHHRFLNDFTHVLLNPLQLGQDVVAALPVIRLSVKGIQAHLMPAVLPIEELSHSQKLELIHQAILWQQDYCKPYFSACLVSSATTRQVADHLSRVAVVASPASKQQFLLRFWDPRVFSQFIRVLDEVQLDALMGPVEQWHWVDLVGTYRCRSREQHHHAPFRIRSQQLAPLQRVGMVNACLALLLRAGWPVNDAVTLGRRVDAALVDGVEKVGLLNAEDCCLYAAQTVAIGMPAEVNAQLKRAVARATGGECSYVGACAELADGPLGLPEMVASEEPQWEQA
ncbi:DUF4123 domain-containing protein [Cupriavidus gilardii]|uniref:DUF4123 domain-containing protein n=1 Tax=Cupriavidus gilardii TaxID=82541 RepID=UPI0015747E54|nr:DUF4123 domain-containing protein [Cupriavidus gilardii]NSX04774.1 DUF4123 domain-containing protein [Cupriavidus gilardii]